MRACKTTRGLLAKKLAAELDAAEEVFQAGHLASCPACRKLADRLTSATQALEAVGKTETRPRPEIRERLLSSLRQGRKPAGRASRRITSARYRVAGVRHPRRRAFWFAAKALAAAGVLLAVGTWLLLRHGRTDAPVPPSGKGQPLVAAAGVQADQDLPRVETASGNVTVERGGRSLAASGGMFLADGDRVTTDEQARALVRYPDRSSIEMNRNTVMQAGRGGQGKRLILERGELFVRAAKQPEGRSMVLNPGRADQVLVVGTAFELACRDDRTRLRMIEGQVAFGPKARPVVVNAGQASSVQPGAAPVAPEPCEISTIAAWRHEDVAASAPAGGTKPDGSSPASPEGVDPVAPTAPTAVAPGKVVVPGPGTGLPTPTPVTGDPDPPGGPKQPGPDPASPDKDKDKKDGSDGKDPKKPPEDRGRPATKPPPPGKVGGPGPGGKPDKGGK